MTKILYTFLPKKNVQVQIQEDNKIVHDEKIHFKTKPTYQIIPSIERTLSTKVNTVTAVCECVDRTIK